MQTYVYGMSKDIRCKKEKRKCIKIIKKYVKEKIKEHNSNLPQIPDHPCRILIIGGSGSGKKIHYLI